MKMVINGQFKKNVEHLVLLFAIRYIYIMLGLQVLSIEQYSYSASGGFDIVFNSDKELLSLVAFFIFTIIFIKIKHNNGFNYYMNVLLYVIYYIPINVAFSINDREYSFFLLTNLFYLFFMLLLNRNTIHLSNNKIKNVMINYNYVRIAFMIISIMMMIYKLTVSGLSFNVGFSSEMIYGSREEYVKNLSGGMVAYLFRLIVVNASSFISPIYLYLSLKKRWYIDIIVALLGIIARYSLTYEKAIILLLPIVVVSFFIFNRKYIDINKVVLRGACVGLIVLELIYTVLEDSAIYYLIIRRMMFLPAWISGIYYEFFSNGSKIWFSQSAFLLENLIPNTYSEPPLKLISNYYFLGMMSSPNTGLFGEAYMQVGAIGVFLFPIIFYVLFRFIEITYRPFGNGFEFVVAVVVVLTITNQPILSREAVFSVIFPTIFVYILSRQKSTGVSR